MSESENKDAENTSEEKKKSFGGIIILALFLVGIIAGIGAYQAYSASENKGDEATSDETVASSEETNGTETAQDQSSEDASSEQQARATDESAGSSDTVVTLDIESLAEPRILGNSDAPVKITEHSSFTCGGCGAFHKGNFKQLKKDFIDTGKAYIVYDDFPRNRVDIFVGAIARCVPQDAYFNFVQLVFETQSEWTRSSDPLEYVKKNAKLTGISSEKIEACVNSQELHQALADNRNEAVEAYDVSSTPTLVINDETVISGLVAYSELQQAINDAYKAAQDASEAQPEAGNADEESSVKAEDVSAEEEKKAESAE